MAYPYVEQTWTDGSGGGTPISAARLAVMEQGIYDAHHQAAVRVYRNSAQSINNATITPLAFGTEQFDQDGLGTSTMHAGSDEELYARVAGKYWVHGKARFDAHATGYREAYIQANGTTIYAHSGAILASAFSGNFAAVECSTTIDMAVNDYVEFLVQQTSGGALNILTGAVYEPFFEMYRIG